MVDIINLEDSIRVLNKINGFDKLKDYRVICSNKTNRF